MRCVFAVGGETETDYGLVREAWRVCCLFVLVLP